METLRVSFLLSRFNDLSIYSEYSDCNFYVTLEADRFCYFEIINLYHHGSLTVKITLFLIKISYFLRDFLSKNDFSLKYL